MSLGVWKRQWSIQKLLRIPQKWMSEELRLGFHVFFLILPGTRTAGVWNVLNIHEELWPPTCFADTCPCRLLTSKYFRVSVIDDVLGVEAPLLRWTFGSLMFRRRLQSMPWGFQVTNHYCHGLQHKDVKPWKATRIAVCEADMFTLCFGARAIQFVFTRWTTKQRLTYWTAQHVLEYPWISCVHALERIWTYCDLANSYLVAFSGHVWSSDRSYWRAIQYILCVCSLKNLTWDHQMHFFGVQFTFFYTHSTYLRTQKRLYIHTFWCTTTCPYVYRRLHACTHCCFLWARLPYLRKVAGALKNVLAIAAGICEVACLVIMT